MDHFDIPAKNYTYMGQYSTLKGEITLEGTTRLASVLEGKVIVAGDYNLVIEREGHIKGDIKCYNLEVHGQISGTICAIFTVSVVVAGPGFRRIFRFMLIDTECASFKRK